MWWTNQLPTFPVLEVKVKILQEGHKIWKHFPNCFNIYSVTSKLELYGQNLEIFKMYSRDKISWNHTFVYHFFKVEKKLKDPVWAPISQPKLCIPSTIVSTINNKLRDHPFQTSANFHDFMSLLLKLTFYINFKIFWIEIVTSINSKLGYQTCF